MNRLNKLALVAAAATAVAASAQAQYNPGDLLLGFTTPSSTGDLVLDLGPAGSLPSGNINANLGLSAAALSTELTTLYGGLGGMSFGSAAGRYSGAANNAVYGTVAQGQPAPILAASAALASAAGTVGQTIGDGSGPTGNSAVADPTAGFGWSWTEAIDKSATGTWSKSGTNPNTQTPTTFTSGSVSEDLYGNINGTESMIGTLSLFSDGNVTFSAVPEPTTYGLFAGLGLLVLALRRHLGSKSA